MKSLSLFVLLNLSKRRFLFLIVFLICLVSQEGSDGLTLTVLFGMYFLAISVMWVVMFAAYVFMLSCCRTFQLVFQASCFSN